MAKKELSKSQVVETVDFARSFANSLYGNYGLYTPQLLNQTLIDLNITPQSATYDKIIKALDNAKYDAKNLQGYSQWVEYNDMLMSRTLKYYANMLSFDLTIVCTNARKSDYKTKEYKEDKNRVYKFLDNFDYRAEFQNMVLEMLRKETVFTWLRTNNGNVEDVDLDDYKTTKAPKFTLQKMPQEYCTLTGYFEYGLLYDFDMNWFLRAGVDINGYDPTFREKFKEVFTDTGVNRYLPTNQLNKRNGTFAYTVQTSPASGAFAFKFDTSNFNSVPFLAPALQNFINDREIQVLQKNKDIASAYGLLVGELKMLDKAKSGQSPDAFAIKPSTLATFLNLIQKGMKSSINVGALPLENSDFYQFEDKNEEMYENQLISTVGVSASASNLLYSKDKMSQEESRNAIVNDGNLMKNLYSQFSNFLEFYINKKTRKFKFKFQFDGINFPFDRQNRQDAINSIADKGMVLSPSAWASAYGYRTNDFEHMLEEASGGEFSDNLMQLLSIHTSSGSNNKSGRPRKKGSLSTQSREYDTSEG